MSEPTVEAVAATQDNHESRIKALEHKLESLVQPSHLQELEQRIDTFSALIEEVLAWLGSYGIVKPTGAPAASAKEQPKEELIEHPDGVKFIPFTPLAVQKDGTPLTTNPEPSDVEIALKQKNALIAANPDLATAKLPAVPAEGE